MTYKELYEKAIWLLEHNEINGKEYDKMIEPLNAEVGNAEPIIRCKDCGQREYGCSTFIDHNQIYGFCAWGWKAERKEECHRQNG